MFILLLLFLLSTPNVLICDLTRKKLIEDAVIYKVTMFQGLLEGNVTFFVLCFFFKIIEIQVEHVLVRCS